MPNTATFSICSMSCFTHAQLIYSFTINTLIVASIQSASLLLLLLLLYLLLSNAGVDYSVDCEGVHEV